MSLAIATVPGRIGEGVAQLLDAVVVELNSTTPAPVIADLTTLIGANARVDGVSIYNGSADLVRVTALDIANNPIGNSVAADGVQIVNAGHTIQFGIEEANIVARLRFDVVQLPTTNPTGQATAVGTLTPVAASGALQFVYVNVIEK